jgi:bifunctional DNA-binding transcriptional regulator/antitoxin component of YhaV-PrlF toxin-antitoxin module
MPVVMTLTAKGQFTFNKSLMQHLGVRAGEQISIVKLPNGKVEIAARKERLSTKELFASLGKRMKSDKTFSLAQIQKAIEQGYAA